MTCLSPTSLTFRRPGQIAYTDLGSALTLAQPNGLGILHVPNQGNSLEFAGFDPAGRQGSVRRPDAIQQRAEMSLVYWKGNYVDVSKGRVRLVGACLFASSGAALAYSGYRGEQGIEPIYGISLYNFARRTTTKLTGERTWSDWSPSWSPDDRYVAFVRSSPQEAMYMGAGEIWVIGQDGS